MNRHESVIYAAGLIDGEGHLGLARIRAEIKRNESVQYRPTIKMKMVDRPPLDFLVTLFGGTVHPHPYDAPNRDQWEWRISGWNRVSCALRELQPYLLVKERQARLLLRLGREVAAQPKRRPLPIGYLAQRQRYHTMMGRLNQRGRAA